MSLSKKFIIIVLDILANLFNKLLKITNFWLKYLNFIIFRSTNLLTSLVRRKSTSAPRNIIVNVILFKELGLPN